MYCQRIMCVYGYFVEKYDKFEDICLKNMNWLKLFAPNVINYYCYLLGKYYPIQRYIFKFI